MGSGQVEQAMKFILSHIKVSFEFDGALQRKERFAYPLIAIREALLNAEAFYLTRNIEKYGSGMLRIRKELQAYPELSFTIEHLCSISGRENRFPGGPAQARGNGR